MSTGGTNKPSPFDGIDRAVGEPLDMTPPRPLSREEFVALAERIANETRPRVQVELHHPRCPKYLTRGEKACRCGTAPLEAAFEDALDAMDAVDQPDEPSP